MKATWAVACLICAFLFGSAGCATGKSTTAPLHEATSGSGKAGNLPKITPPAATAAITEENVVVAAGPGTGTEGADTTRITAKPPANQNAASTSGPEYRLGPEDVIRVSVWENKDLTLDAIIRPDGMISMPLVQDIRAEGLTAAELANGIRTKLLTYIQDPQVSVILLHVNAPKYYVIGNVVKPGVYPLRNETSVLQALSLSGGFAPFASPRKIRLIRITDGKTEVRVINYNKLIDEGGEGNYLLKSGDTLVVP